MYERRKQLAIRLVLRYDMLRGWKVDGRWSGVCVASLPPTLPQIRGDKESGRRELGLDSSMDVEGKASSRRPFMPNIISTLIAAPHDGWTTRAVYDRMKHHVTGLDTYLLLSDEEIEAWSDQTLLNMTSQVILQWQWLRRNNDILEDMEVHGYAELDGKADDNEWIADDIKRPEWGKGVKDHTVNTEKGIPKMGDEVD
ncbi:hypothetical protein GQ44DRAFT_718037 [Phaeosphaeriaceae sp. PMI808]|nr:hypothetical protein GQ44DRAFT_718037 [Phaeosphaeriaceae sp. PMI808]